MEDINDFEIYIFDYEGTLSDAPSKRLTLNDLLYKFDFRELKVNEKIYSLYEQIKDRTTYVIGIIECNREIEQKKQWLKVNYPNIKEENYIFVSSDYKKSDVIKEIINFNNYSKDKILFIDDKSSHIDDVRQLGIKCLLVDEI